jgi:hypothetical protein
MITQSALAGVSSFASFDVGIEVVAVQQDTAAVAAGVELAESDQVVDPVLAASQALGGLNNVQSWRDDRGARWDESGSTLGYFGELLIGEPDGQLNHLGPPSMTRVAGIGLNPRYL